ncbi:hypothetical protein Angca_005765, partial [Angiostrongylus cantonensis]
KKVMVTGWWSTARLIYHSFLDPGATITAEKYCQQIDKIHSKLQQQQSLVERKGPILLHDRSRPHVAEPGLQKLNELGYESSAHPPYSSNL